MIKPAFVATLALLVACSNSSGNGGGSLHCGGSDHDCSCSVVSSGSGGTCGEALGSGTVCCASAGYPSTGGTDCVCIAPPAQVNCGPTADGNACTCSLDGDGGAPSCVLGMGICCMAPGTLTCTCYLNQTACGASELSTDHCDASVIAQNMALSSFCAANQGPGDVKVTACSPFQP